MASSSVVVQRSRRKAAHRARGRGAARRPSTSSSKRVAVSGLASAATTFPLVISACYYATSLLCKSSPPSTSSATTPSAGTGRLRARHLPPAPRGVHGADSSRPHPTLIHVVDLEGARDGALRAAVIERCRSAASRHSPAGLGRHPIDRRGARRAAAPAPRASSWARRCGTTPTALGTRSSTRSVSATPRRTRRRDGQPRGARMARLRRAEPRRRARALSRALGVARLHVTAIDRDGTHARARPRPLRARCARAAFRSSPRAACATTRTSRHSRRSAARQP